MEENGNYGFLSLVLKTNNLGELLTVMDDVGEIMGGQTIALVIFFSGIQTTSLTLYETNYSNWPWF